MHIAVWGSPTSPNMGSSSGNNLRHSSEMDMGPFHDPNHSSTIDEYDPDEEDYDDYDEGDDVELESHGKGSNRNSEWVPIYFKSSQSICRPP